MLNSEPLWAEKEIELDLDLEKVHVTADQESMSQVWINLIHNSIKFTPSGGTITIQLKEHETVVEVRICDSGIGISEEQKQHILSVFIKRILHEIVPLRKWLRFSYCKESTRSSSREIKVESEEGKGTEFIVRIPNYEEK